jgi:hypothetical protein
MNIEEAIQQSMRDGATVEYYTDEPLPQVFKAIPDCWEIDYTDLRYLGCSVSVWGWFCDTEEDKIEWHVVLREKK